MDCYPERYAKYFEQYPPEPLPAAPPTPPPPPVPPVALAGAHEPDPPSFGYEHLITRAEHDTYLYVKKLEQDIATAARSVLAELCHGVIGDGARSKKQFVNTRHGKYRASCRENSDNTTETAAMIRMGATKVNAGNREEALAFLGLHGVDITYAAFIRLVIAEWRSMS
jgi:hypothetical protein